MLSINYYLLLIWNCEYVLNLFIIKVESTNNDFAENKIK
jgi:hypothetical protein